MGFFYTDTNNEVQGPLTLEELQGLQATGTIRAETFVIEENTSEWKRFSDLFPQQPSLKTSIGLQSPTPATTTLYTLTHTGPINLRQVEIAKKTPKAILLKDYTRLADGSKKKLLMIGIDTISKTPADAVRVFIQAQTQRVQDAETLLKKEKGKLEQAVKLLAELEQQPDPE